MAEAKGQTMFSKDQSQNPTNPDLSQQAELEELLRHGLHLQDAPLAGTRGSQRSEDDESDDDVALDSDVQGAYAQFAEATQDVATAGVELALGRHFACVDYCNQAAEKAAQAVSLLRSGHRTTYNHDLRALGLAVDAPPAVLDDMSALTPFHPEAFYAGTPPEEADEVISAEQATAYIQTARRVLRWARGIIL
jgi:HEPN domain-containing protein